MPNLSFCDKCGNMTTSMNAGEKCWKCISGKYVSTGVNWFDATNQIKKEYYKNHTGKISAELMEQLLREKYYYGKLDQNISKKAVKKRIYYDTPQAAAERERDIQAHREREANKVNLPKCPSCGSTDLKKISISTKVVKVKLFGLLGTGDLGKTYQCKRCGIKF